MLDTSYTPLYKKIYDDILKKIKNKKYSHSNKLPSENSFSNEYSVNRHTIRHALELLKNDGHIYTKKGIGNFIGNINIPYKITDKNSYSLKILDLGYKPKTKLLSSNIIEADKNISEKLVIPEGFKVIELKLLRYVDNLPIQISYSYFDAFIYKKIIDNLDIKPFSIYKILENCYSDLEIIKIASFFQSIISTKEHSIFLDIPQNSPILSVETISKDQNGNFVEYGISHFRGDVCKVKIDLIGDK